MKAILARKRMVEGKMGLLTNHICPALYIAVERVEVQTPISQLNQQASDAYLSKY